MPHFTRGYPRQAVTDAGATAELLSIEPGTIQATNHDEADVVRGRTLTSWPSLRTDNPQRRRHRDRPGSRH